MTNVTARELYGARGIFWALNPESTDVRRGWRALRRIFELCVNFWSRSRRVRLQLGLMHTESGYGTGRLSMKLVRAALLAVGTATTSPAQAEIDASQADAKLIGMPICTSDGLLAGQVTGIEF